MKQKYKYEAAKGNYWQNYIGEVGEWVNVSKIKYYFLKINGYKVRISYVVPKLTDLIYIAGDFSIFRSDRWFSCAENKKVAIKKLKKFVSIHPYSEGAIIGRLDELKFFIKQNGGANRFISIKIKT